jgi:cytochrome c553
MNKHTVFVLSAAVLLSGLVYLAGSVRGIAQTTNVPKMPEVVILGKDSKLGQVTFNHVKHNGGAYTVDGSSRIACISCHHVARPAAEIAKFPPLRTAWPANRTTTLTGELFAMDPRGAGVAACRSCHARTDERPKLLDTIPEIKHEGSTLLITLNNQQALHRTCSGCHVEVKLTRPASKGPVLSQCMMCHKKP